MTPEQEREGAQLLRELLERHFYGDGLKWRYLEDTTIADVDAALAAKLEEWMRRGA